jgi:hypothetical protein
MPCLEEFQSDYDLLADYQKEQFSNLLSLFYSYIGTYVGEDELFGSSWLPRFNVAEEW